MLLRILVKDKDKRKRIVHIVSGVIILFHSYEKYESGHESYVLFGIAGVTFLTIALLHPIIERKAPWIDGVFLIIEGFLSILVAYDFFHAGKKALPLCYCGLAVFQFFMARKKSKKGMALHKAAH